MTKKELENKVVDLTKLLKQSVEIQDSLRHELNLAKQGGGHTQAYDELMDRARELQRECNALSTSNQGYAKTIAIIKAAIQ